MIAMGIEENSDEVTETFPAREKGLQEDCSVNRTINNITTDHVTEEYYDDQINNCERDELKDELSESEDGDLEYSKSLHSTLDEGRAGNCMIHPQRPAKYLVEANGKEEAVCSNCALTFAVKGRRISEIYMSSEGNK